MKKIAHHHRLSLETITPVSIGDDGIPLSPFSDFVFVDDRLAYIDQKALEGAFARQPAMIDQYVQGVKGGINLSKTSSDFDYYTFLVRNLQLTPDEFTKKSYPVKGVKKNSKIQILPMIRNAGLPYLSGSSLKGAIKGAILYDWLLHSDKGKRQLEGLIKDISALYKSLEDDILDREDLEREKADRRGRLSGEDKQYLWDIKGKIRGKTRNIDRKASQIEDTLFGKFTDNRRRTPVDFYYVRVSDSTCVTDKEVAIYNTARLNLRKASADQIPQCREMIMKKATMQFTIDIIPKIAHPDLQYLNSENINSLLEKINHYSLHNLDYDIDILDTKGEEVYKKQGRIYNHLFDMYEGLYEDIEGNQTTGFMRIGAGKTYFHNSIGLAIYRKDKQVMEQLIKLMDLGKVGQKLFPITRTLITHSNDPMGWVKIKSQV